MEIIINGKKAWLKEGSSFEYVADNRLFSGSDSYSLTITFPLRGCAQNLAIFGHINRADMVAKKAVFDCIIFDRNFIKHGTVTITEISETEVKTQFLEGRSENNYSSTFDDIYINELDLGSAPATSVSNVTTAQAWKEGVKDLTCVALPWVNNESGNIQNCPIYENGAYKWDAATKGLSWQPYLIHIVKKICRAVGYSYDFLAWENREEHRFLLMCNTIPWVWDKRNFASPLPHWTLTEFFEKLELFLDAEFDIDHRDKHIHFAYTQTMLATQPPVKVVNVLDEHSVSVAMEDENCDYREANNLAYSECEHNMWKFYSCDWFIKAWKDNVVKYATLSALLTANKGLAVDGSTGRGSNIHKVLYAADVDTYFVARAIEKTLIKEDKVMPNSYSYRYVLQPVNTFGTRIVDESDDADCNEIDFVPAWIDYTEKKYGNCLFLPFTGNEGATESTTAGSTGSMSQDYKEKVDGTFYQPFSVQSLEAGDSEKKSEYYNKIYLGWWNGETDFKGKLPYPLVDDVVINEDWSGYFRTKAAFRLNSKKAIESRIVYKIDTKRKYTFKFLADTLPSPRAIFHIRGKKYVCEKLTATFSREGMSQLVKGDFWQVID